MTDHPILIPTARGPVGAIVSEPDAGPSAALVLLQGGGPPARCGVNAIWTRIARELAERGVLVLRFDFACEAESAMVGADVPRGPAWRSAVDLPVGREVIAWFRERAGIELLLAGSCYGARMALELGAEDPRVEGVFVTAPYLAGVRQRGMARNGNGDGGAAAELPNPPQSEHDRLSAVAVDSAREIVARGRPLWILIGEQDDQSALELESRLRGAATGLLEVEVAPGVALHPGTDPAAQELTRSRLVDRIVRAPVAHAGR